MQELIGKDNNVSAGVDCVDDIQQLEKNNPSDVKVKQPEVSRNNEQTSVGNKTANQAKGTEQCYFERKNS